MAQTALTAKSVTRKTRCAYLITGLTLVIIYLLPRLILVWRYPVFNDEAIYLRYGKIMGETSQRFYSLAVIGKQPLIYWIYWLASLVVPDPLLAGRLISVVNGFFTLGGVFLVGRYLGGKKAGIIASILYAVCPLTIFFDSLAIVDTNLATIFIFLCYLFLRQIDKVSFKEIAGIGLLIGFGLWIKTTAILYLILAGIILVLLRYKQKISKIKLVQALVVIYLLSAYLVLPLILRPEFVTLLGFQKEYSLSSSELLKFPWRMWETNALNVILICLGYLSPFLTLGALAAISRHSRSPAVKILAICILIPLAFIILIARSVHARYVLFPLIPLFPLAALTLAANRKLLAVTVSGMLILSGLLVVNTAGYFHFFPQKLVFATESYQYVDGWPSGYGVKEALAWVNQDRQGQRAFVGVRWDSGNPEDSVLLFATRCPGLSADFFDPMMNSFAVTYQKYQSLPIYFITRKGQLAKLDKQLKLVASFPKPRGAETVEVYRFTRN